MKISVLLPAFNAARTIQTTIESVLRQTVAPAEFIILDDGSTDATPEIVRRYGSRIQLISTSNQGVASARNALCSYASGDLLAFLDADDIWHPQHLEQHCSLAQKFSQAVAFFSDHLNFTGYDDYRWENPIPASDAGQLIPPLAFFRRYHKNPGPFSSMSFCTVPRSTFSRLTEAPFQADGAEDYYFFTRIALLGPVAYTPVQTVAYRFHPASLSSNRLHVVGIAVQVYELLERNYRQFPDKQFHRAFREAFASARRHYAKFLLGADAVDSARDQLHRSLGNCMSATSLAKSLGLLALSYFPHRLQPRWLKNDRSGVACQ